MTKVTAASPPPSSPGPSSPGPQTPPYDLPPSILSESERLMAAYDDLLRRTEEFSRLVADQVRDDPEQVADLVQQLSESAKVVFQRWTLPILYMLSLEPAHELRYSQIRSFVHGISGRSLSLTLDEMERRGLLSRKVSNDRPPHVTYALTPRGQTLSSLSFPMVLHLNMTPALREQLSPGKAETPKGKPAAKGRARP
jgi:DNA-binding HxlR family transcriptional regulator